MILNFLTTEERDQFLQDANLEDSFQEEDANGRWHFISMIHEGVNAIAVASPAIDNAGNFNSEVAMFFLSDDGMPSWAARPTFDPIHEEINHFIYNSAKTIVIDEGPLTWTYYNGRIDEAPCATVLDLGSRDADDL